MEAMTVISSISTGLSLVDKFVDLVNRIRELTPRSYTIQAMRDGDDLTITSSGQEIERVSPEDIKLNEWDDNRYKALEARVMSSFKLYNALYVKTSTLSVDERVRIELRMEELRRELCDDFQEMIQIYEKTLNMPLQDHYSLYQTCGDYFNIEQSSIRNLDQKISKKEVDISNKLTIITALIREEDLRIM